MANIAVSVIDGTVIGVQLGESTAAAAVFAATASGAAAVAVEAGAFAEEFSGPAYETIANGEAATTTGHFFRVSNGDTPRTYTRYQRTAGGSVVAASLATSTDLASADGAAMIGLRDGSTVADVIASADVTLYVDPAGNDTTGTGSLATPFATPQKALDSLAELTRRTSAVIEVAAGTYSTSSRAAASMDRPAVVYIDGLKIGKRTAQSGTTLSGGLVIKLAAGAKITPNATYPRGIYVTGHSGSVGIVGGEIEAAAGAESLIVAHRGSYVHVRDTVCDGNGIAQLGLVAEAGGYLESINVTATGSVADATAFYNSVVQMAAPSGTSTVGNVSAGGAGIISLASGMSCTGTIISRGGFIDMTGTTSLPVLFSGNYDGQGGQLTGANVRFTNAASSIVPVGEIWKVDNLHSNAAVNLRGGIARLNGFQSFVAPATQSTHAQPLRRLDDAKVTFSSNLNNLNNAGLVLGPDLAPYIFNVSADSTVIPISLNGQNPQVVQLNNIKGSLATGCTLSLDISGWLAGTRIPNGQLLTVANLGGNGVQIIHGSTLVGLNSSSITIGATTGQVRSVTFVYLTGYGKWMPVSFGQVVA